MRRMFRKRRKVEPAVIHIPVNEANEATPTKRRVPANKRREPRDK